MLVIQMLCILPSVHSVSDGFERDRMAGAAEGHDLQPHDRAHASGGRAFPRRHGATARLPPHQNAGGCRQGVDRFGKHFFLSQARIRSCW